MRPVEGTILTVVRAIAEAVEALDAPDARRRCSSAAREAARDAVARTPDLLPVLRDAGVVDAGGKGLTLLLDAFLEVVDGRPIPEPELVDTPAAVAAHLAGETTCRACATRSCTSSTRPTTRCPAFRDAWAAIGDSIVVVGGDGIWNCHVHTNDIGAAVEAGIDAGRPHSDPHHRPHGAGGRRALGARGRGASPTSTRPRPTASPVTTAVVAVGVGDGVRRLLTSLGVQQVVAGGQSMNPSTAQILEAVEACAADCVIVLPNNKNIVAVAKQVDALTEKQVAVVATTSVPEALAALVEYDPNAELDENEATMTSRARARAHRRGHAGRARRRRSTAAQVREGDWIALVARRRRRDRELAGRRGVRAARQARRRRQRDRHRARRLPTRAAKDTERIREHIEVNVPAPRGRVPRRRPAALPVPRRRGIAGGTGCRPATRRSRCGISATIELARLKGVGPALEGALADMGLHNVLDLLQHYPRRWIDRTKRVDIAALEVGEEATVIGEVRTVHGRRTRNGSALVEVVVHDGSSLLNVTFFNQGGARSSSRSAPRCRSSASSTCTAASAR